MLGSVRIARLKGIPVHLHVTGLLVLVGLVMRLGWLGLPAGVLFFGSLLVHEMAHALAGRACGIATLRIDLNLLGGMAVMTRPGRTPRQELLIAAAGPAASLVLGLVLLVPAGWLGAAFDMGRMQPRDLVGAMAALNLFMGLFNLVPALPMDGGRMFRAALSPRFGHVRATTIAAWVSRGLGVVLIVIGLTGGHSGLAVVGGLLFWMVAREERAAPVVEAWRRQGAPAGEQTVPPQTREEFVDRYGRRYVIVTKVL